VDLLVELAQGGGFVQEVQAGEDDAVPATLLFDPYGGVGGQAVRELAVGGVQKNGGQCRAGSESPAIRITE
jgi:hypothetical protein